jgi:hypothetical protein
MLHEFKLAMWTLFAILLPVGIAVVAHVLPILNEGEALQRAFLSHAINKQILDRRSMIASDRISLDDRIDVTDLFPQNMVRSDFEDELEAIGYVCRGDSGKNKSSFSLCSAEAGYTFACGKKCLCPLNLAIKIRPPKLWRGTF